jgi:antitoxin (DNA-binding transcriptional repressor) of toxin-antitoxin stability system
MKTATTHQAKTHLSRLLKEVQAGETVVILNGSVPVAKLTAVESSVGARPPVGTLTSAPVRYTEDAFGPLSDEELREWDLS